MVHVYLFPANLFVAITSLFLPKQIVYIYSYSEHSVFNKRRSKPIFRSMDKFIYSRFDKIVCVSSLVEEALHKWIPGTKTKTVVVKNAIPVKEPGYEKKLRLIICGKA